MGKGNKSFRIRNTSGGMIAGLTIKYTPAPVIRRGAWSPEIGFLDAPPLRPKREQDKKSASDKE